MDAIDTTALTTARATSQIISGRSAATALLATRARQARTGVERGEQPEQGREDAERDDRRRDRADVLRGEGEERLEDRLVECLQELGEREEGEPEHQQWHGPSRIVDAGRTARRRSSGATTPGMSPNRSADKAFRSTIGYSASPPAPDAPQ